MSIIVRRATVSHTPYEHRFECHIGSGRENLPDNLRTYAFIHGSHGTSMYIVRSSSFTNDARVHWPLWISGYYNKHSHVEHKVKSAYLPSLRISLSNLPIPNIPTHDINTPHSASTPCTFSATIRSTFIAYNYPVTLHTINHLFC